MTVLTHCLPTGTLDTNEIAVSNISDGNVSTYMPAGGLGNNNIRGVVVSMHGLSGMIYSIPIAIGAVNDPTVGFQSYGPQLRDSLVADGWIVISVAYPEDFCAVRGALAIYNDFSSDTGHGSRYKQMTLHWWDHVVDYVRAKYGSTIPIVPFGVSWGGWHTLLIAANRTSTLTGYFCHVPATVLQVANYLFTSLPNGYYAVNSTGADIGPHDLDTVNKPGVVGYGTNDEAIGFSQTTYTGSNIDVSTLTGSQSLSVADSTQIVNMPAVEVATNSSDGYAVVTFTGISGGALMGCKTLFGSGTLANGNNVIQNNIKNLLANAVANAPTPPTPNPTGDTHEFTSADATYYANWVAATLDPLCPKSF